MERTGTDVPTGGSPVAAPFSTQELIARAPVGLYVTRADSAGTVMWVSDRAAAIFGLEPHELVGDPEVFIEHLHPDDRERALALFDEVTITRANFELEYRIVRADGTITWVLDVATWAPDAEGGPGSWHGLLVPVDRWKDRESFLSENAELLETVVEMRTQQLSELNELLRLEVEERRRMTAELAAAAEHYRTIVEGLPVLAYVWDLTDGGALGGPYSNPVSETHFTRSHWGFIDEDSMQRGRGHWIESVHPDDRERVWRAVCDAVEAGGPYRSRHRWVTRDGRVLQVLDRADVATTDAAGRPTRYVGVLIDLTEITGRQRD